MLVLVGERESGLFFCDHELITSLGTWTRANLGFSCKSTFCSDVGPSGSHLIVADLGGGFPERLRLVAYGIGLAHPAWGLRVVAIGALSFCI